MAFIALIYGMYAKISRNYDGTNIDMQRISLNLNENYKIVNIEVIDKNRLLLTIKHFNEISGAIYNIENKKISEFIVK